MNDYIRGLNVEGMIFFDIETASKTADLDVKSHLFRTFQYKHRDRITEKLPTAKETQELWKKLAGMSPVYGKVVCFSIGYVKSGEIHIKSLVGDEKEILTEATKIIDQSGRLMCSFNGNGFDLPYSRMRAISLGINYPERMNDVGLKPWIFDQKSLDLLKQIQGSFTYRINFEELCELMGVESPKDGEVTGSGVSEAYHAGKIDKIAEYCERDVKSLINVFLKMQGKPIIE